MKNKKLILLTSIFAIGTLGLILLPYQDYQIFQLLRIVFASVFILFLPGYRLTFSFFQKNEIDGIERFGLGFALSISVVPLLTFFLNSIGLKINEINVFIIAIAVIFVNILYLLYFDNKGKPK